MTLTVAPVPTTPSPAAPAGRRRRRVVTTLLVVLVLLLLASGWLAWRASQVASALEGAVPVVGELRADLEAGEVAAATARLPGLRDAATTAHDATADPLWRAAERLPWLGTQLRAVGEVTDAFDLLALEVVPALTAAGAGLSPADLQPVDGQVDLGPVVAAGPHLTDAATAATRAQAVLDGIATDGLVGPLAVRVVEVQEAVGEAAASVRAADTLARVVPPMLGADGPRDYLVLVLNSAELRNGGGLVGAVAKITAQDGAVALADHRAAADLPAFATSVLPLDPAEEAVHSTRMGRWVQNVTMTPDFPRAAGLATEFWRRATGETVDGVLALDVTALSYVLGATGPVQVGDVRLDADGVVGALLHESYLAHPDPDETDAYFADAASAVFGALAGGQGDPRALLPAVTRAADERRLLLWSAHPDEQQHVVGTVLGGAFLSGVAPEAAGVFLEDGTGSKIDYLLDVGLSAQASCDAAVVDGAGVDGAVTVGLDLRSTVPEGLDGLPEYVVGAGAVVPPGTARTHVTVYAPTGGEVVEVRRGGAVLGGRSAVQAGREVVVVTSTLAPGERESLEVVVRPAPGGAVPEVWSTPTVGTTGRMPVQGCVPAAP